MSKCSPDTALRGINDLLRKAVVKSTAEQAGKPRKAPGEKSKVRGKLSPTEVGYGKVLTQLIQAYERSHIGGFFVDVAPHEALEHLLQIHNMRQAEAAEIAGVSRQNLNDFLKGRRGLPKEARVRLSKHFKVGEKVFDLERERTSA